MSDPAAAFAIAPGITYMDAATYGIPPRDTITAMQAALDAWASGTTDWQPFTSSLGVSGD